MSERSRVGGFFLSEPNAKYKSYRICWFDPIKRQTVGITTGTTDRERAQEALAQHTLKAGGECLKDEPLASSLARYYENYGCKLASAKHIQYAIGLLLGDLEKEGLLGNVLVSELGMKAQWQLIEKMRARKFSDSTIERVFGVAWAAIRYGCEQEQLAASVIPKRLSRKRWKPHFSKRERVLTEVELGKLFDEATPLEYRYLVLALATAARPSAVYELRFGDQIDLARGIVHLNPAERAQNSKHRATLPMAPILKQWLEVWEPLTAEGHVLGLKGRRLRPNGVGDIRWLFARARIKACPYALRHKVGTWLAEQGVPTWERDQFMGHRVSDGNPTGAHYAHYNPELLRTAAGAIQKLFEAVADHTHTDLLRRGIVDQPLQDAPLWHGLGSMTTQLIAPWEIETERLTK